MALKEGDAPKTRQDYRSMQYMQIACKYECIASPKRSKCAIFSGWRELCLFVCSIDRGDAKFHPVRIDVVGAQSSSHAR